MRRALLLGALVLAAGAPEASAHLPPELAVSKSIARDAFPTACEPTIAAEHRSHFDDPNSAMWATSPALYAPGVPCEIGTSVLIHYMSPAQFCSSLVHEYGHLTGLQHSSDPASIMHAPAPIYPPCRRALEQQRRWRGKHWRFGWAYQ